MTDPRRAEAADRRGDPAAGESTIATRPLILVVDDEPDIRSVMVTFLTDEGYDVAEAGDGLEALAAIAQRRPDAIVCDVLMPRLDGGAFIQRYRQTPGPHAPIIIASASSKHLGVALPPDADAYAEKPFDFDYMLELLTTFARKP